MPANSIKLISLDITITTNDSVDNILGLIQGEYGTYSAAWHAIEKKCSKDKADDLSVSDNPLLLKIRSLDDTLSKAIVLVHNTQKKLTNDEKGPLSEAERELWSLQLILSFIFLEINHHQIIQDEDCCTPDGEFLLRQLTDLLGELRGQYRLWIAGQWKTGCTNHKSKGILGRIIKNFSSRNDNSEDVEEDEDDEAAAAIDAEMDKDREERESNE